jgi:D-xylose 1-dehydrogenase (NADP+, D-xylono-1,5-lactone-forming)
VGPDFPRPVKANSVWLGHVRLRSSIGLGHRMSTNGRTIRWGVLGVARILKRLRPALEASPTATPLAIASRCLGRAQTAARDFGFERAYGSYEELLSDPDIDAVYIPLPNTLHAKWTIEAAKRGKHILCEKPLCPTAAESAKVVEVCRALDVRLMDGFMWPHHPRTHRVREAIDAGVIGDVRRVTAAFTFRMEPLDPKNIRLRPDLAGGSLLDVGCYTVSGIRWAIGAEPVRAFARARKAHGVDIEVGGQLLFPGDRMASFDCGFTIPYRAWLEVAGEKGTIRVPKIWAPPARATWEVEPNGQVAVEHAIDGEDQIVRMLDEFATAIWEGRDPRPGPGEALKTLRVLDAIRKSIAQGSEVDV